MTIKRNLAISDSGFLFNPSTGDSFSLNPIAQEIFNYLKAGRTYDEIENRILQDYGTDASTFEKDYKDFLDQLNTYKLLENE